MPRCRPALLALVLCALVSTACSSGETATSAQQGTATPTASTTEQVPATVEGREDEWPYDSDWLSEVRAMGAEQYYPPLQL